MCKKIINLGLIGFGKVGAGVVRVLQDSARLLEEKIGARPVLKKIADVDISSRRDVSVDRHLLTTELNDILDDPEIEVVIELTGTTLVAKRLMLKAMSEGKHIVTANKAVLAQNWAELFATAKKNRVGIFYEASVGAGIPVIQVIREGLAANHISRIFGILNGTTNYILTRMQKDKINFEEALDEARKKGFAEPDPSLDIGGFDSMHKIVILSNLAFGKKIEIKDVYVEGIDRIDEKDIRYGEEFGYSLKLLAIAKETGTPGVLTHQQRAGKGARHRTALHSMEKNVRPAEIEVRVHPTFLPKEHLLSSVEHEFNAIYIVGDLTGPIVLYGRGAGQRSASSAVIGDLIYLGRKIVGGNAGEISGLWEERRKGIKIKNIADVRSRYYLRFSVVDSPGVLAKISNILGRHNISIAQVIQKEERRKNVVPVVMMTHEAVEKNVQHALSLIDRLKIVKAKTVLIRVEDGTTSC